MEQSRETSKIKYTRHRTKTNKGKNTTQKTKKMNNSKMLDIITRNHTQNTIRHEAYYKQL
jgi:hypothetical protein